MGLSAHPRFRLAALPTPLQYAERLTAELGGPKIYLKRDDLTGLAMGGNKTRKLEYLVADALAKGATHLITVGAAQSNHARQTAAAARLAGLGCHLVLNAADPEPDVQGNLLLDKLLGAANIWCWDGDAAGWCERLQALGIQRILWSNRQPPEQIATLNAMPDVISSRYDIYQDVMDPGKKDQLRGWHSDWPSEAWPQDLMLDERGQWRPGWQVKAKDGTMIPCGVLCDKQAPDYARQRIAAELQDSRYQSRFIDTTTASPWRECYHPDHPMTRSESRQFKMELLKVVADEFNLITGCETGHDAAVPYCDYFEGMLSLGPYRVPDSGRDMARLWDEVPERVGTNQTGERYRLPLWELVYHDCVVAQWYWGDYNNKLPSLWDRRDLWNALYATPPMYMFNKAVFEQYQDRFVKSYQTIAPIVREAAYQPMVSHKWLTADHTVQQTTFANGLTVTVNFGNQPYPSPGDSVFQPTGPIVQPMSYDVQHASIRGIPGTPNF